MGLDHVARIKDELYNFQIVLQNEVGMTALTVSPKFQVVIPKAIRQALKLKTGQKVYMRLNDQGQAVLEPELDIRSARGFLPKIPGVDVAHIENDPEGTEWPGGCTPIDDAQWLERRVSTS